MPETPSLNNLVTAIAGSVLEAQEKVEAAQLANLMSYFRRIPGEKGFFPISMQVNLPSLRTGALPGTTDAYRVPYLSVLPYSALRIKQVDVNFDVAFSTLNLAPNEENGGLEHSSVNDGEKTHGAEKANGLPHLSIDLGAPKHSNGFQAHVRLSLENVELPEGASRLINELIKTGQVYDSPGKTEESDVNEKT